MTTVAALRILRDHAVVVELDGTNLRLQASAPLPPSAVTTLRAEKAGLVRLLTDHPDFLDRLDDYEERAAIMEYDARLPRAEAERLAWLDVFGREV